MVSIETVSIIVAATGVFLAAINQIISNRRAAQNDQKMLETRQAQLFAQISSWWRTREAVKAYGKVWYVYTPDYYQNKLTPEEFFAKYHITGDPEAYADQIRARVGLIDMLCVSKKSLTSNQLSTT